MARKAKLQAAKKKATAARKGAKKPVRALLPPKSMHEERFTNDLLTRGEAAPLSSEGKLPLHATHVIEKREDGTAAVKRVRYKMF